MRYGYLLLNRVDEQGRLLIFSLDFYGQLYFVAYLAQKSQTGHRGRLRDDDRMADTCTALARSAHLARRSAAEVRRASAV